MNFTNPKITDLKPHPLADLVPAMAPDEYEAFKADIHENGQRDAIVLYDGKILDGRRLIGIDIDEACVADVLKAEEAA